MFEKDLRISFLLDFYGDVLTERKRDALEFYYNDDMSLSEIAEEMGISRQGARDIIKKAEDHSSAFLYSTMSPGWQSSSLHKVSRFSHDTP